MLYSRIWGMKRNWMNAKKRMSAKISLSIKTLNSKSISRLIKFEAKFNFVKPFVDPRAKYWSTCKLRRYEVCRSPLIVSERNAVSQRSHSWSFRIVGYPFVASWYFGTGRRVYLRRVTRSLNPVETSRSCRAGKIPIYTHVNAII